MRETGDQYTISRFRRTLRWKFKPQVWGFSDSYRSVRRGMANSADQPYSPRAVATAKLVSQFKLNPAPAPPWERRPLPRPGPPPPPSPSFVTWASYSMPAGLVPKTNPFCLS